MPKRRWTDEQLAEAVRTSATLAAVSRALGLKPGKYAGIHRWLKAQILTVGLSTQHFTGQAPNPTRQRSTRAIPLEQVMVKGSTYSTGKLRQRLVAEGLLPGLCAECGIDEWRGRPVPLMLDHINGDPTDHRMENVRILCPNCHSQTPTWCNRARRAA